MSAINIGDLHLHRNIIQGGMGIGVSRSRLAGAVASEGGMGVISAAQVGYDDPEFRLHPEETNLRVLPVEIKRAKQFANGRGAVAVNIMSVTQLYGDYVKTAVEAGVDAIISGAGLPTELPRYIGDSGVKFAPIVSTERAGAVLLKRWDMKFGRVADFIVMESPYSGGHQGYKKEQLTDLATASAEFDEEVRKMVESLRSYEDKYGKKIPVFVGGGVMTAADKEHYMALGAAGIQVGTRFIATYECDASDAYKQAFVHATAKDLMIIDSPVGMPARAIRNPFVERMIEGSEKITFCYNCLKACNPAKAKYCISQALINAVKGDLENGLIFCSEMVDQIHDIKTVREVMDDFEV